LTDRVAVVTGASSGIGAGLAAMLAAEGARGVLAARRGEELERVTKGIRQDGAGGARRHRPHQRQFARQPPRPARAELGPVDILVYNAGYVLWKPLEATAIAEWDQGHPRQPPQQRDQGLDRLPRLR
jgi:NADP-dependent 3-hydroxy acid dehydrogenase YdfG